MDAGHVAGRLFGEIRACAHRSRERDQPGHRVGAHEAPGLSGAEHQVEDPGREDLTGDLGEDDGALGRVGTRLEHHRVACGQSGPDLPDEHHEGVVPRDDLPDDADGLAANLRVQTLGVLPRGDTRLETGGPGEEPQLRGPCHDFLRPDHLGELTGVAALSLDETVGVGLQGVGEPEQEHLPFRRRCQPPALECLEGGVVGGVDIGGTRDRALRYDLFRSRIHDVERGIGGCRNKFSVDKVLEERKAHVNHSVSWLRRDVGVEVRSFESRKK